MKPKLSGMIILRLVEEWNSGRVVKQWNGKTVAQWYDIAYGETVADREWYNIVCWDSETVEPQRVIRNNVVGKWDIT